VPTTGELTAALEAELLSAALAMDELTAVVLTATLTAELLTARRRQTSPRRHWRWRRRRCQ
jgi:predicted metal-dependent hydrolase